MPEKLLESDFLTTNLRALFSRTAAEVATDEADAVSDPTATETTTVDPTVDGALPPKGEWLQWGELLKQRLTANRAKSREKRKPEYDIETEFFKEFYAANWEKEIAEKLLLIGEPLKKVLKVVGFKRSNPILGFINQEFVKNTLLHANLLNVNTFKAIYNAVANDLVADTEFFKRNDYNIIYCKDLYRKSPSEMEEYLKIQKSFLSPSASQYSAADLIKNKIAFFYIADIKELNITKRVEIINNLYKENKLTADKIPSALGSKTTLNSLALVEEFKAKLGIVSANDKNKKVPMGAKAMNNLVSKLTQPSECFAVIQHLSITTDVAEAKNALKHEKFKGLTGEQLAQATAAVAPLLSKGALPDEEAKALVALVLGKLE